MYVLIKNVAKSIPRRMHIETVREYTFSSDSSNTGISRYFISLHLQNNFRSQKVILVWPLSPLREVWNIYKNLWVRKTLLLFACSTIKTSNGTMPGSVIEILSRFIRDYALYCAKMYSMSLWMVVDSNSTCDNFSVRPKQRKILQMYTFH